MTLVTPYVSGKQARDIYSTLAEGFERAAFVLLLTCVFRDLNPDFKIAGPISLAYCQFLEDGRRVQSECRQILLIASVEVVSIYLKELSFVKEHDDYLLLT
jgi:hypothetical protein